MAFYKNGHSYEIIKKSILCVKDPFKVHTLYQKYPNKLYLLQDVEFNKQFPGVLKCCSHNEKYNPRFNIYVNMKHGTFFSLMAKNIEFENENNVLYEQLHTVFSCQWAVPKILAENPHVVGEKGTVWKQNQKDFMANFKQVYPKANTVI